MTSDEAGKAAKDIGKQADVLASSAKSSAETARDGVKDFAGRASAAASDMIDDSKMHAREVIDRLPDASEAVAAGRRAYEHGAKTVGKQVAQQPLEALLLAGAIGFLVGWAANRA